MSTAPLAEPRRSLPWGLWARQIAALLGLEVGRSLRSRRTILIYLLAAAPVLLWALYAVAPLPERVVTNLGQANVRFAVMFRAFFLRFAVFFGCVGVFMNLFRGDVLEKTLHYYFLVPLRREVLVVGKYLSGLITTFLIFAASATLSYLLMYAPAGSQLANDYLFNGPGLDSLTAYVGVTLLACVGYGSVFLAMGLIFRNPMIPAAVILGWESINFLLPPLLKKVSVIHYLESLCPVSVPPGAITILADPASPWVAIPGLLLLTALVLAFASLVIRRKEIRYASDD